MLHLRLLVWCLFITVAFVAGGVLAYPYVQPVRFPTAYTKELTATGLVERVRYVGLHKRHCVVEVATYTWINLSPGFPLQDIPHEGDRYTLYAPLDICRAVQVSAAAANGHVLYKAGEAGGWYLIARPEPAFSCGGIANWQPPPR